MLGLSLFDDMERKTKQFKTDLDRQRKQKRKRDWLVALGFGRTSSQLY